MDTRPGWPSSCGPLKLYGAVLRLLRDFIEHGAAGTTAWALVLDRDHIRLNVGGVRVLSITAADCWFAATPSAVRFARGPERRKRPWVYPSVRVPSEGWKVLVEMLPRLPQALRRAALGYLDEAAVRCKGTSRWADAHSQGVVELLAELFPPWSIERPLGSSSLELPFLVTREGAVSTRMRKHYSRDRAVREAKLAAVAATSPDGRLSCEVPGCGFDFEAKYGELGKGFAHVHHRLALAAGGGDVETSMDDLAVVCANCHAIIHRDGACRDIGSLIRQARKGA